MKCPFCGSPDSKVVDSRPDKGGATIRRRRECETCTRRFTTHERVEEILPLVLKKDGRREPFDRLKLIAVRLSRRKSRSYWKTSLAISTKAPNRWHAWH